MLTVRKDAGSGNKRILYWNGRALNPVDHAKYWEKEAKRLQVSLDYEVIKREAIADELEETISTNQTMLKLADTMINAHRRPI